MPADHQTHSPKEKPRGNKHKSYPHPPLLSVVLSSFVPAGFEASGCLGTFGTGGPAQPSSKRQTGRSRQPRPSMQPGASFYDPRDFRCFRHFENFNFFDPKKGQKTAKRSCIWGHYYFLDHSVTQFEK